MANVVVCADGTWNTPEDKDAGLPAPTNVVRLYNALPEEGDASELRKYYHPGVGTDGSMLNRVIGGGVGKGLSQNVMSAYKWLAVNYRSGDKIFLFGFSRGAYTIRSLGGLISCCGLLDLSDDRLADREVWDAVEAAFQCYRERREDQVDLSILAGYNFHDAQGIDDAPKSTRIHFVGVWDTVGALGIPDDLALLNLIDDPKEYQFHDTNLSEIVEHARHAVAMDEMRHSFTPTLWTGYSADRDVKQIWFPGVHGDVGGGYFHRGLSDGALKWMMDEAEAVGLKFRDREKLKAHISPDPNDVLHDSLTGIFSALRTEPRQVPRLREDPTIFHASAFERYQNPPLSEDAFWPTKFLEAGDSERLPIFARPHWNATKLFLEKGASYEFKAEGEWLDREIKCDPGGLKEQGFRIGEVVHEAFSFLGRLESVFRQVSGNSKADFIGTKRREEYDWFALVGMIASGAAGADASGLPGNEFFLIGSGINYTPKGDGYLYCFANDAWHAYDNNRGSVRLTVTRLT